MGRWNLLSRLAAAFMAASTMFGAASLASAQNVGLAPGDAVVSGFSGIKPSARPLPPGANPLDHFFIDLDGPSAQILALSGLGGPANGQLVTPGARLQIKAKDIGQVFAIAMDDGLGGDVPNIYLGSTSAYGIFIVGPDADGNGEPDRLRSGQPGATFMPGQFGRAPEGNPGTIWRVDGRTGEVTVFATLPGNSGPGIGDIAFDKRSRTFYVSDLDMGQIHRFDANGVLIDSFDHGVNGRPAHGLAPLNDDGAVMDITSPSFDSENPETWGYTQADRMVYGMAVHNGRLYYAVAGGRQVFSIGLGDDGKFAGDPRWELDATALPGDGPVTDILFDKSGRMYLAQRGRHKGSYNYSEFAEPAQSSVVRYRREQPNDPATPGVWVPEPQSYAIGMPEPHQASNGGIALGFGYDAEGNINPGTADSMLWTTGGRLRPGTEGEAAPGAESDVHGLQGNEASLVRPQNVPPQQSYFVDYDGLFSDPEKAGHVGDVEIWQPERRFTQAPDYGIIPPGVPLPPYVPPVIVPGYDLNLALTKRAGPTECADLGARWRCSYTIRVRNTSPEHTFTGEIRVRDHFKDLPAGATIQVPQHPAPWFCSWIAAPDTFACRRDAVLAPNASVSLRVHAYIPKSYGQCFLTNTAEITHPLPGSWQNTDWSDDADDATALIPAPNCRPDQRRTNLKITKAANPTECVRWGDDVLCRFRITVWNDGPGFFSHQLQVQDNAQAGTTVGFAGPFNCAANGGGYLCTHNSAPLGLFPMQAAQLWATVRAPLEVARANDCQIRNTVRIVTPHGAGHPMNTNAGDDTASAVATVPEQICNRPDRPECPPGYRPEGDSCVPRVAPIIPPVITPPGIVPPPPIVISCPPGMVGRYPNCRWIDPPKCPPGTVGRYPSCRVVEPPKCPPGTVGRYPHCRVVEPPKCPPGTVGRYPNCRKIELPKCPPGTTGRFPVCRPIAKCPPGTVGRYPNCRKIELPKCPPGTTGRFPACRPVAKCPPGTVGRFPNCRKIVQPPGQCPRGTVGRFPNCRPVGHR